MSLLTNNTANITSDQIKDAFLVGKYAMYKDRKVLILERNNSEINLVGYIPPTKYHPQNLDYKLRDDLIIALEKEGWSLPTCRWYWDFVRRNKPNERINRIYETLSRKYKTYGSSGRNYIEMIELLTSDTRKTGRSWKKKSSKNKYIRSRFTVRLSNDLTWSKFDMSSSSTSEFCEHIYGGEKLFNVMFVKKVDPKDIYIEDYEDNSIK